MSTVLKQYLNQNPQNPLNERKSPFKTLPKIKNIYILPSNMQTSQHEKGTFLLRLDNILKNRPISRSIMGKNFFKKILLEANHF